MPRTGGFKIARKRCTLEVQLARKDAAFEVATREMVDEPDEESSSMSLLLRSDYTPQALPID
ncbi:hypothetical protein N7539_008821 [Penicillium diatomitis]|uniref:Uncharacterized protein n=1 Tax=Penicillium diatomitis TaxID=2819901 RepID=A0A9X0BLY0_9EURO|nr:uncharacterized protein N7539_008821 [Penicillium diatomitis]KAJ5471878.1 hypothetical protein N7539_008821 [Penicillium diatomitis]